MGRVRNGLKKSYFRAAAVAGILILLVFAAGCSGDLLGYIKELRAQAEFKGIVDLPRTGQTTCYDTDGNVIAGSGTGQDGDLQMGIAWPEPRFTDNGNGTITDELTGLMWDQSGNTAGGPKTWAQALSDCNGLSLGGHDDWRLPNRKELRSLVNYEVFNSADWLNNTAGLFTSVLDDFYWSSTTYAPDDANAWYVYLYGGHVNYCDKETNCYLLAVRSGQAGGTVSLPRTGQTTMHAAGDDGALEKGVAWPDPRFTDKGNGTIYDNLTGLMWEQAPSGTSDWTGALEYANDLDLGGHRDWRLPNVNELESLINAGQADTSVWLNTQGFSGVEFVYWSSTTSAPSNAEAWYVSMSYGIVSYGSKGGLRYLLAVRGG